MPVSPSAGYLDRVVACKFCGAGGLHWQNLHEAAGPRLVDSDLKPHSCAERKRYFSDLADVRSRLRIAKNAGCR
jgi:hypothetical protein